MAEPRTQHRDELPSVARLALKLGTIGFGGPAAHVAMLHDEVVRRRGWLSEQRFLDLLGATNLIPGPNSTEMMMHVGRERAGWRGLVLGGALFILPAMTIVLLLAWLYVRYGALPAAEGLMYGIKPVIIAIVLHALLGLARTAAKGPVLLVVGVATFALYLARVNELLLLAAGGLVVAVARNPAATRGLLPVALPLFSLPAATAGATGSSLVTLCLTFLKIGAVLYGSGYVLLAFLRRDFVDRLHWLTDEQLLDAVAVGQVTPGPLFTTATFIGYLVGGLPGGILATIAIFLPAFVFVALLNPLVGYLRRKQWLADALDGVNAAAIGLMAAVAWELGRAAIIDWPTALLAVIAALLLVRFRVNSAWLVLGGGLVGIAVG